MVIIYDVLNINAARLCNIHYATDRHCILGALIFRYIFGEMNG